MRKTIEEIEEKTMIEIETKDQTNLSQEIEEVEQEEVEVATEEIMIGKESIIITLVTLKNDLKQQILLQYLYYIILYCINYI